MSAEAIQRFFFSLTVAGTMLFAFGKGSLQYVGVALLIGAIVIPVIALWRKRR